MGVKRLEMALALATYAHAGQKDKAGVDYIEHPVAVAKGLSDEDCIIVALLHDVLEDTFVTAETIENLFGSYVRSAVEHVTHRDGEDYMDYVKRASKNIIARKVKIEDLRHNMDLSRLKTVTEKDLARRKKYEEALEYLLNAD